MNRPKPLSVSEWFDEIMLAIADARGSAPVGNQTNQRSTNGNLFHIKAVDDFYYLQVDY